MELKSLLCLVFVCFGHLEAGPVVDEAVFGKMLSGWTEKNERAASYEISGAEYRTWKPHVTPTLDGGIFVSVRIDHLRGILASDDHASLELAFDGAGDISSARSTIALQGRKVSSDLIRGGGKVGASVVGADRVVKVGADLIADLSSKLLNEKVSEPGRVGFPAALRHNYNLLCLSVRLMGNRAVSAEVTAITPPDGLAVAAVPVGEEGAEPDELGDRAELVKVAENQDVEGNESGADSEKGGGAKGGGERREVPPLEVQVHGDRKSVDLPGSVKK